MKISGNILVVSGLHIGGADDTMKIGGVDSPVIKREIKWNREKKKIDYINGELISEPYIPGSSLKGKIRSLLEHYFGLHKKIIDVYRKKHSDFIKYLQTKKINSINEFEKLKNKQNKTKTETELLNAIYKEYKEFLSVKKMIGDVISSKHIKYFNSNEKKYANVIIKLFGESAGQEKEEITIASLIFRDSFIISEIREKALDGDLELTEEKFENVINRISGTTKQGGLRQIERVVPGIQFSFDVIIRDINELTEEIAKNVLFLGMKLLENDYLGGNGSRGYGEIKFIGINEYDKEINELKQSIDKELTIEASTPKEDNS